MARTLTISIWIVLGLVLTVTAGCAEQGAGDRDAMPSDAIMMTAADTRHVVTAPQANSRIVCAEPGPEVAQTVMKQLATSNPAAPVATGGAVSPEPAENMALSRSEALAQLGQHLATTQLLRDGMYRACEAYANGAISKDAYAAILSRYDQLMITMILGEFAASSTTRIAPVTLTGEAETGGTAEQKAGPVFLDCTQTGLRPEVSALCVQLATSSPALAQGDTKVLIVLVGAPDPQTAVPVEPQE
jgi:hypothetical protein